jgi:CHAD domain-containing protein
MPNSWIAAAEDRVTDAQARLDRATEDLGELADQRGPYRDLDILTAFTEWSVARAELRAAQKHLDDGPEADAPEFDS